MARTAHNQKYWTQWFLFLTVVCGMIAAPAASPAEEVKVADADAKKKKKGLPLEPGRTVRIQTDRGSWLSVDVSPDGKQLVFDFLGDLYLLPIEGGTPTQVTSGMAFDAQPRFSPDGKEILFTSDRDGGENLWILEVEGGKTTQLTEGKNFRYQSPEWAPDGRYILASRTGLRSGFLKLWMFHREGGSGLQLIDGDETLKVTGAAFGNNDRYIWFAQRSRDWQYNAIFPQYQVAVYDRETGEIHERTDRFGSAFRPTLSSDGRWLVYGTRHDAQTGLRLRDLNDGSERWLAYPVQHDDQESRGSRDALPGMSFTPDSESLVASYGGQIWKIPLDGTAPTQIPFQLDTEVQLGPQLDFDYPIDDSPLFVVRQIRDAVPSPDGTTLAFTALNRLYTAPLSGGEPALVTSSTLVQAQPVWSPDGRELAYVTWDGMEGHLWRVAAGGGTPRQLTTVGAVYQQPAWSPDGERIILLRGPARTYQESTAQFSSQAAADLVWVPATGGEATWITPSDGRRLPHFRADESGRIYFSHRRKGLVSIRWDGTDEKAHLEVVGSTLPGSKEPTRADSIQMAPRGELALAQIDSHLYSVTVPIVGGDTPKISVATPDKAPVPVRKLTDIGGQFPVWSGDGRRVHWSIGNAHVVYDLDEASRVESTAPGQQEETAANQEAEAEGQEDSKEEEKGYQPQERRFEITATRDIPEGEIALTGARIISMNGSEVIERGDLLIRNNRIAAVGPSGSLSIPGSARVFDVSGKTVMPGFVDVHAHMRPSFGIHKSQVWSYLANLAYGVTTTRDPQTGSTDVLTYSDMVRNGAILGPRIYSTGPGVFWGEQIKSLDHARKVLKRYSEYYDTKTIKMYVAGNRETRQWIIQAAREQQLMPTTEGSLDLKLNLTQVIDGYPGHEHSFPVFPLYKDVIQLTAESGVTYTPTLLVAYGGPWAENYFYATENVHDAGKLRRFTPHEVIDQRTRRRGQGTGPGPGGWFMTEEHVFDDLAEFVRDVVEAGGRAGVGSHGQLQGLGFHWELWAMQSGGLSTHDALKTATIFGAEAIGLDRDLGSIEVGKLADLIVLDRNPLEDIRHTDSISQVVLNGRLYQADSLSEVAPRNRPLGNMPWQEDEPDTAAGLKQQQ